jgi:hypothetical protein
VLVVFQACTDRLALINQLFHSTVVRNPSLSLTEIVASPTLNISSTVSFPFRLSANSGFHWNMALASAVRAAVSATFSELLNTTFKRTNSLSGRSDSVPSTPVSSKPVPSMGMPLPHCAEAVMMTPTLSGEAAGSSTCQGRLA